MEDRFLSYVHESGPPSPLVGADSPHTQAYKRWYRRQMEVATAFPSRPIEVSDGDENIVDSDMDISFESEGMTEGTDASLGLALSPSPMTSAHGDSLDEIQSDITNESVSPSMSFSQRPRVSQEDDLVERA